jgi:hypothetical protein
MILYDLTRAALDAAAEALGPRPVTMVNLLWFRPEVAYAAEVADPQPDPCSALYKGYGPAVARVSQALGVEGVQRVFVGHRACGLVAGPQDDWDDIVIVRYRRFADFRTIVESEPYARLAKPHHRAAILNWRISATFE